MARGITRKDLKRDEFVEATVGAGHWLENNWRTVALGVGAALIVVLVALVWMWNAERSRERARGLLAEGMLDYRRVEALGFSDRTALESAMAKFEQAADEAGTSPAGLVATFYRAAALHRLNRSEEALPLLESLAANSSTPRTLRGSAQAMLAELHVSAGRTDDAQRILDGLVGEDPPSYPVDQALLALSKLHRAEGREAQARAELQRILDEYPAAGAAQEADRLLGED